MDQENEMKECKMTDIKPTEMGISFLRKPQIPHYDCLTPVISAKIPEMNYEKAPFPGFGEFRKFKRVNETRTITPYEPKKDERKPVGIDEKAFPAIDIENPERFLIERIKSIPVESLESLLQMIYAYPDIGFVTMNRRHMDLLNDYQPYKYTICNYNEKDETNYVTISRNGLVEFYKGDADFMPLNRLLEEYEFYLALQKIPLFSYLHLWKAFMVWLKKIRRKKFEDAKAKLEAFFAEKYKTVK